MHGQPHIKFIKMYRVGAELFHADGRTDRHDETNSRFSVILLTRPKVPSFLDDHILKLARKSTWNIQNKSSKNTSNFVYRDNFGKGNIWLYVLQPTRVLGPPRSFEGRGTLALLWGPTA